MRVGQPVDISIDAYHGVTFHGHVENLSPAAQNKFSLVPPQNATGNFVKVTQRLPVRIAIDDPDPRYPLAARALRSSLRQGQVALLATALTVPRGGAGFGRALPGVPRDVVEHGWRLGVITFAIITATLLEIIDVTIVNVALPNIEGNFGASVDQAAWIGTGYIIANVIVIPLTPWLQRRFGRREYYAASIAIFTVASIACGLSSSRSSNSSSGGSCKVSAAADSSRPRRRSCAKRFRRDNRERPRASSRWASSSGRRSDRCWAASSPTSSRGAGRSSSTCRSGFSPSRWSCCCCAIRTVRRNSRSTMSGWAFLAVGIGSLQYVLDQGTAEGLVRRRIDRDLLALSRMRSHRLHRLGAAAEESRSSISACCATARSRRARFSGWSWGSAFTAAC